MLSYETSTELLLTHLLYITILCTLVLGGVIFYIGRKLVAAIDDLAAAMTQQLQALNGNVQSAVGLIQQGGVSPATLQSLQAVSDGLKAANNSLAAVTGGQQI